MATANHLNEQKNIFICELKKIMFELSVRGLKNKLYILSKSQRIYYSFIKKL